MLAIVALLPCQHMAFGSLQKNNKKYSTLLQFAKKYENEIC